MDNKEDMENISPNASEVSTAKADENGKDKDSSTAKIEYREPEPLTTKVYYFVDDQPMPYSTEIPIPPSKITLDDFKGFVTKRNYKCYCKVMDAALNAEVKAEIRDDSEKLKPNANGRYEIFLLSENIPPPQSHLFMPAASIFPTAHHFQTVTAPQQGARAIRAPPIIANKRASMHYPGHGQRMHYLDQGSSPEDDHLFASSLSDGDSQYTTTDFTSVSQQKQHEYAGRYTMVDRHGNGNPNRHDYYHPRGMGGGGGVSNKPRYDNNNKPYWTREKRKCYRRSPPQSFLSSTFEDTEISMAVDLITVTFNMNTTKPFGLSIVVQKNRNFQGIVVHQVAPNSIVAIDGRIKPGYILLEINGIPLDEFENTEDAIKALSDCVKETVTNKGQLKLTCARGEVPRPMHNIFRPPVAEPVRPIDPTAWVQHTNAERGLNIAGFELSKAYYVDMPKSASATIPKPKTNPQMKTIMPTGKDQSTSPLKANKFVQKCTTTGLKIIQNPSTEITTTSDHSSMECSVGQEQEVMQLQQQQQGGAKKANSGRGHNSGGGFGSALRRLVCIMTGRRGNNHSRKRKAANAKRSANKK